MIGVFSVRVIVSTVLCLLGVHNQPGIKLKISFTDHTFIVAERGRISVQLLASIFS